MPIAIPRQEGISGHRRLHGDELAGPPLQKIKGGATLQDLTKDYALFSYAPLVLYAGFQHNPVQEWITTHGHDQVVFILQLEKPILHFGSTNSVWDRTLWVAELEYWPSLRSHIGTMAGIDRAQKKFSRPLLQVLPITDVIAAEKSIVTERPTVSISVFAVDSNKGCLAMAPAAALTGFRPYLKFNPPREETVRLTNALLKEENKPYEACQLKPWEIAK